MKKMEEIESVSPLKAKIAIAAAVAVGICMWAWWISFDNPKPVSRPHAVLWDVVSMDLHADGIEVAPGESFLLDNPLLHAASWLFRISGRACWGMTAIQLPLLALLLVAVAAIAWRSGGPLAGAVAAWTCLFMPTTLGLATTLDDHLCVQAMVAASLALMAWSDRPGLGLLGPASAVPMLCVARCCLVFSTGLLALLIFGLAVSSMVLKNLVVHGRLKRSGVAAASPAWQVSGLLLALIAGPMLMPTLNIEYISYELRLPEYSSMGFRPQSLLAYPIAWAWLHSGPALSAAAALSVIVLARNRKVLDAVPALVWLLAPMILLGLIPKRNDYYMLAASPAAAALVGMGAAAFARDTTRAAASILAVAALAVSWTLTATDDDPGPRTINPFGAFQEAAAKYLVSPYSRPSDLEKTAAWMADECSGRQLYFIRPSWNDQLLAYFAWRRDPSLKPGDLLRGPDIGAERPCLAVQAPIGSAQPATLRDALGIFAIEAVPRGNLNLVDRQARFVRLLRDADSYRLIAARGEWSLFAGAVAP